MNCKALWSISGEVELALYKLLCYYVMLKVQQMFLENLHITNEM